METNKEAVKTNPNEIMKYLHILTPKKKKTNTKGKTPSYLLPLTLNSATGLQQVGIFNALPRLQIVPSECS